MKRAGAKSAEDEPVKLRGQRLAEILRAEVLDGTLEPGTRIRQEELAARLGSSRIPIREALHQLEAEGLVVVVANSGAWVAKIDLNECMEIYKIRERLEPLALANSVENITDEEVLELERLVEAIERCATIDEFLRLDRQFHFLSYRSSSFALLRNMIAGFWNKTQYYRRAHAAVLGESNRWIIHAEHRLILEAIRNRDPEDAERVLAGHIRRTRLRLARNSELFQMNKADYGLQAEMHGQPVVLASDQAAMASAECGRWPLRIITAVTARRMSAMLGHAVA